MNNLLLQLIIACIVLGFAYWVWTLIAPLIAQFVAEPFMGILRIIVLVIFGFIALFYILVPLLKVAFQAMPKLGMMALPLIA